METKHTNGALAAAAVVMNGNTTIMTQYGKKTLEGVADLIERETGALEILEALKGLFEQCAMIHRYGGDADNSKEADAAINAALIAIAKATK